MGFVLRMRFASARALYRRYVQAHKLIARNVALASSHQSEGGTWWLGDERGPVAKVRGDGTVIVATQPAPGTCE